MVGADKVGDRKAAYVCASCSDAAVRNGAHFATMVLYFCLLNEECRNLQPQEPFFFCSFQHGTTSWSSRESFILRLTPVALLFEIWSLTVTEI